MSVNLLSSAGCAALTTLTIIQFARISVWNILSYLKNYWVNRPEYQRVVLSMLRCVDYTVVSSICKNKLLIILSYLKNYWVNRPECQRVVLSRLRCADYTDNHSICKNKCFIHFFISQKLLAQSTLVSTRCAEQVALRRHTVVSSIYKNKVLNILLYLWNYWVNRPECQRVVLSRLHCAEYTVVSSIFKNKVLNILSYLRNYWVNRPECQRVVLSR
jgi:hypothetical protein